MLTLGGFQPVESTSPFKVVVSDVNLHPYTAEARLAGADDEHRAVRRREVVAASDGERRRGKAVQVDSPIRLTLG